MKVNAGTLKDLLAVRHYKDVFVAECKSGSTWFSSHRRIDAWAMRRSWKNFTTWAYEIKVSRSDFLKDSKWRDYLPLCHQFYFVCPPMLIDKSELPQEAGLIVSSKNGTRLYTKKKAPEREVELPNDLLVYILMGRSKILPLWSENQIDHRLTQRENVDFWRAWLKEKADNRELGYAVSKAIREHVYAADQRVHLAEKKVETYEVFREKLRELNIDPDIPLSEWNINSSLEELRAVIPKDLTRRLAGAINSMEAFQSVVNKVTEG